MELITFHEESVVVSTLEVLQELASFHPLQIKDRFLEVTEDGSVTTSDSVSLPSTKGPKSGHELEFNKIISKVFHLSQERVFFC